MSCLQLCLASCRGNMFKLRALSFLFPMSIILRTSSSMLLPSAQFLEAISTKFQMAGVKLSLQETKTDTLSILAVIKHLR